jgi:hypothetical protein
VLSLHFLFHLGALMVVAGLAIMVWVMILRGDVRRAIPFVILSWAVSSYIPRPTFAYYTDPNGVVNSFGVSSLLLAIVFLGLLAKERAFVARFLRTPMFVTFYVLFACAVLTQCWYLGFVAGSGLAYDRVLQPMMVVALMGYLGRSQSGLRRAFLWIIGAVALAIVLRYAAGTLLGPASVSSAVEEVTGGIGRVSGLGSYTIYGTICASILPLGVSLLAVDHGRAERVALVVVGLVTVKEVLGTGTRGAILGFIALLVFLLRRRARWWMVALVGAVLVGGVAFGFRAGFSGSRALSLDVSSMLSQPNTRARLERNLAAIHYIVERPLSGSGLGLPLRVDGTDIGTWVYNPYLAWGVAMGLMALLAFAAIGGMSVVYSLGNWRASSGNLRTLQVGLTASLIVWFINQFTTGDSLTYLQSVQASFFFYAIVGLILGSRLGRQQHPSIAPTKSG